MHAAVYEKMWTLFCSQSCTLTSIKMINILENRKEFHYLLRLAVLQCEWLLGDRKPSPEDMDKGIDTDSPLFQAILENPVVQLGLTNPKTLLGTVKPNVFEKSSLCLILYNVGIHKLKQTSFRSLVENLMRALLS